MWEKGRKNVGDFHFEFQLNFSVIDEATRGGDKHVASWMCMGDCINDGNISIYTPELFE